MARIKNISSLEKMTQLVRTNWNESCPKIWTPYSDEGEEGVFKDIDTGEEAQFLPWFEGQPNE